MAIERALEGVGGFLDDRFRGAKGFRTLFKKVFPDHWTFLLGEIALYCFIILLLTGTFLTFFFQPSMTGIIYHGSYTHLDGVRMSEAYASTLNISFDVRGGLLMRQIHHWAADLFMAAIFAHMLRLFFTGAYRKPREVNWLIGLVLLTLGMLEGLFGYSLPDDLLSGAGLRILEGVMQSIPIVGTYLAFFLFGGAFPGHLIIPRLYILHVLLVPGADHGAPVHHVPPEAHPDAGQGPDRPERRRRAHVPVLHGEDRRVLLLHLRCAFAGLHLRPDQPGVAVRPVYPGGNVGRLAARLLYGHARGRAAGDGALGMERRRAHVQLQRLPARAGTTRHHFHRGGAVAIHRAVDHRRQARAPRQRPAAQRAHAHGPRDRRDHVLRRALARRRQRPARGAPRYRAVHHDPHSAGGDVRGPGARVHPHQTDLPGPAAQGQSPAGARRRDRGHPAAPERRVHRDHPPGLGGGACRAGVQETAARPAGPRFRRRQRDPGAGKPWRARQGARTAEHDTQRGRGAAEQQRARERPRQREWPRRARRSWRARARHRPGRPCPVRRLAGIRRGRLLPRGRRLRQRRRSRRA